jgi:hypothetical protein
MGLSFWRVLLFSSLSFFCLYMFVIRCFPFRESLHDIHPPAVPFRSNYLQSPSSLSELEISSNRLCDSLPCLLSPVTFRPHILVNPPRGLLY